MMRETDEGRSWRIRFRLIRVRGFVFAIRVRFVSGRFPCQIGGILLFPVIFVCQTVIVP